MHLSVLIVAALVVAAVDPGYGQGEGWITFSGSRGGDKNIYMMRPDGSDLVMVANAGWHEGKPCFSPDGRQIVYGSWVGDGSQWMVNRDGSENARMAIPNYALNTGSSFDWSPDGHYLAVAADPIVGENITGMGMDIYVVDLDESWTERLAVPADDKDPAWSPDGRQIAYTSFADVVETSIWVMTDRGKDRTRLTGPDSNDKNPAWSPDGTQIAFASKRTGDWEIWVMDADGANPLQLTDMPDYDHEPAWSPDGTQIAYSGRRDGNWEIYIMDADGSNSVNITNDPGFDSEPSWVDFAGDEPTLVEMISWGWVKQIGR